MINLSYAITVCNEHIELANLVDVLKENIASDDEIIILVDEENQTSEVKKVISGFEISNLKVFYSNLNDDFGNFKNTLNSHCSKKYIFQIDADELLGEGLLNHIKEFISLNPADSYLIPRINVILNKDENFDKKVKDWNWRINKFDAFKLFKNEEIINFPDSQMRLYRNVPNINLSGKVHEQLTGMMSSINILNGLILENNPLELHEDVEAWCLFHVKNWEKQIKQNEYYNTFK